MPHFCDPKKLRIALFYDIGEVSEGTDTNSPGAFNMQPDARTAKSLQIVEGIVAMIGDQTDEAKGSEVFRRWLKYQQAFWRYSWNNTILMAVQAQQYGITLSNVAGSTKWNSLNRKVKGEEWNRRLWILAPIFKTVADKATGKDKSILAGFRSVYVFDHSQTEGEEAPTLEYRAKGDDAGLVAALENVYRDNGITLEYRHPVLMDALYGGAKGVSMGKTVHVSSALQGAEKAGTLAHELAHSLMHFRENNTLDLDHSRSTAEIEAESVAACVLGAWGLDSQPSSLYIACWGGDSKKIRDSMTRIAGTSKTILSAILPAEK